MGWKKMNTQNDSWDFEKNAILEGVFIGKKENVGKHQSNLYMVKIASGETVSMWGSTVIDNQMFGVENGSKIKVEFLGMATSEKGGTEYKNFIISVWED